MAVKKWPAKNKAVPFDELATPLRKAILFAYDMKRKNEDRDVPWTGLDNGSRENVSCLRPDEALTKGMLDYDNESQGRDALDVILAIAIRLGIEQGRRILWESLDMDISLLSIMGKSVQGAVKELVREREGKRRYKAPAKKPEKGGG